MFFVIDKGKHRNFRFPRLTFKSFFTGTFTFIGDVSYKIKTQTESNRLFGFSDGWYHRRNSVIIGWRWNTILKKIDIVAIVYVKGKKQIKTVARVNSSEGVKFSVYVSRFSYTVSINNRIEVFERKSRWFGLRYLLFPYFGGETKAPKDFKFNLKIF